MDGGFLARRDEGVCWAQMTEEQRGQGRAGRVRSAQDFLIAALELRRASQRRFHLLPFRAPMRAQAYALIVAMRTVICRKRGRAVCGMVFSPFTRSERICRRSESSSQHCSQNISSFLTTAIAAQLDLGDVASAVRRRRRGRNWRSVRLSLGQELVLGPDIVRGFGRLGSAQKATNRGNYLS